MLELSVANIRELKGAPLAVLVLLSISVLPVSQEWLSRSSGYTDKPIHQACQYLYEKGLIDHSSCGWFMLQDSQLPLGIRNYSDQTAQLEAPNTPDDQEKSEPWNNSDSDNDSDSHFVRACGDDFDQGDRFDPCADPDPDENSSYEPDFDPQNETASRNNSDPLGISSINLLRSKDLKDLNTTNTTNTRPTRKKSDSEKAEIWDELSRLDVHKNPRTDAMIELEHVTAAYIRTLARNLKNAGWGGPQNTGLFIHACEEARPVDEPATSGKSVEDKVAAFFNRKF